MAYNDQSSAWSISVCFLGVSLDLWGCKQQSQSPPDLVGWVGKMKPSGKSQTAGSTSNNIMLRSNLEIMSLELCFSREGERELEIKYTLNRNS